MSARSTVSTALLLLAGVTAAGPATAVMYRCDGNLVTDSPNGGKNCVPMGSRLKSPTFSAGSVEATVEAEPTGAGPAAAPRQNATPQARASGSGAVVPNASVKH